MDIEPFTPVDVYVKSNWNDAWGSKVDYLRLVRLNKQSTAGMDTATLWYGYGKRKPPEAAGFLALTKQNLLEKFVQLRATFPDAAGTTTGDAPNKLINSGAAFFTAGILPGTPVSNTTDGTATVVKRVDSQTQLTMEIDIFDAAEDYTIGGSRVIWTGFIPNDQDNTLGADNGIQTITAKGLEYLLGRAKIKGAYCDSGRGLLIDTGDTTAIAANKLIDDTRTFTADDIRLGAMVYNMADATSTHVTGIDSDSTLSLADDIFPAPAGDTYEVRGHIESMPAFNERYGRGGGLRGNRAQLPAVGLIYKFSAAPTTGGFVWTAKDAARYLVHFFSPFGMWWELSESGGEDTLDALEESYDVGGLSLREALNRLIPASRGLGWYVDTAGDAADPIYIKTFSRLQSVLVEGGVTLTANSTQTDVIANDPGIPVNDLDRGQIIIRRDASMAYDAIRVRGRRVLSAFSLSGTDGNLEKDWFYLGGTTDGAAANKLCDSTETFVTKGVKAGMFVKNTSTQATTTVSAVDNEVQLTLTDDIMAIAQTYEIGLEAEYRHVGGDDAKANDQARTGDKFDPVFSRFRIPPGWDWMAADGIGGAKTRACPEMNAAGVFNTTRDGSYWNPYRRLCRELPFISGYDYHTYTANVPTNLNTDDAEPEYLRPFAILKYGGKWYHAEDLSSIEAVRRRSCSVRMSERGGGIVVKASPAHVLALNHWTGARPTETEPVFDWDEMVVTVCAELDERPFRWTVINVAVAGAARRELVIDVPECEIHHVNPTTILGVDADGALVKFSPPGGADPRVIRDDTDMLEAVMAAARAWYSSERNLLEFTQKRLYMGLQPGTLVTNLVRDDATETINTVVDEWIYDAANGMTTVRTGHGSIDFGSFATNRQFRDVRRSITSIQSDIRALKRSDDHRVVRPERNPGERVGPLTLKFLGDLSEESVDPYWSGGLTYPTLAGETKELYNSTDSTATVVRCWYSDPVRAGHVRRLEAHMANLLAGTNALKVYPVIYLADTPCPGEVAYPLTLTVTGGLTPDVTGYYVRCGNYNGKPCYVRLDGAYWIANEFASPFWLISSTKGQTVGAYWQLPTREGIYLPQAGAVGNATVSITAWATLSASTNRSPRAGLPVQYGGGVEADELVSVFMEATVVDPPPDGWDYADGFPPTIVPLIKAIVEHEPLVR